MARISEFSKDFVGADGAAPKNTLIIELLEKHGAGAKTASSKFPEEFEKAVTDDLKAQGYTRAGAAEEKPAPKSAPAPEKEPVKQEKPAEKQEAEAPKNNPPQNRDMNQEQKPQNPAAPKNNAGAQPQGMPKKKKTIIITGGNVGGGQRSGQPVRNGNGGGNGGYGRPNPNLNRGPIKPRDNMIDRAGAISNRHILVLRTFFIKVSENSNSEPKSSFFEVKVSFVCESNIGFSIKQFTNIHKCCLTC